MRYKKIKGATDFYPDEKSVQDEVFSRFKASAERYGFSLVEPPIIESMSLLTAKSGEEIRQQIFTIEKKGTEELGMRFEFTAGVARMFIEKQKSMQKPVKWYSIDRVWRYERPQAGRDREFYQFNAEVFGSKNPEADAEVINLAIDSLRSLGLRKDDFYVNVNNRKLLTGLLLGIVSKDRLETMMRVIDKRSKITEKEFDSELSFLDKKQLLQLKRLLSVGFSELSNFQMNDLAREGYENLRQLMQYLPKDTVRFELSTARGLAYYTGTVFEIFDSTGKYRALCGGGRYDEMISLFGGEPTPATGFGMGYSTVSMLLSDKGLMPKREQGTDYLVAVVDESVRPEAMKILAAVRKRHSAEIDLMGRSLSKQLKYANSIAARKVIFVGPEEVAKKRYKVKDMKTGKEVEKPLSEI
ncbi:histidine--tRNA ligase [Candidatus Woesearchaeota archaeon]|nr:histidine--tRNA ligase [Candidatus Woesearchaeota archaeon]